MALRRRDRRVRTGSTSMIHAAVLAIAISYDGKTEKLYNGQGVVTKSVQPDFSKRVRLHQPNLGIYCRYTNGVVVYVAGYYDTAACPAFAPSPTTAQSDGRGSSRSVDPIDLSNVVATVPS